MSSFIRKAAFNNTLVFGRPGIDKYQRLIMPYISSIIKTGEPFVVTDPEDIILRQLGTILEENGYSIISFNLRNPQKSNSWNPLYAAYEAYNNKNIDLCIDHLYNIATTIMSDDGVVRSSDPFWDLSAIDLFVGLALILFKEAEDINQINMSSIYYMAQIGFLKFGQSNILNNYFLDIGNDFDPAQKALCSILTAPSDTRGSILSVFYQKIRAFTVNDMYSNILCTNDISFENITESKTAIFICYEDETSTHNSLVKIFLRQLFHVLIKKRDVLNENEDRYHFILTNFLSIGCFPEIDRFISSCNSRHIDILLDIYSINASYKLYGNETTSFILAHCSTWYIMSIKEIEMQLQINQILFNYWQEYMRIKSIFCLMTNEIFVIEDGKPPRIEIADEFPFEETYYTFKNQPSFNPISIFKFDDLVKKRRRDVILKSDGKEKSNLGFLENNFNVDELIRKIDQKIAELEVNEKIETAIKNNN